MQMREPLSSSLFGSADPTACPLMHTSSHTSTHKDTYAHACKAKVEHGQGGLGEYREKHAQQLSVQPYKIWENILPAIRLTDAEIELVAGRWRKEHQILKDDANQKLRRMRVLRSEASKHVFPNVSYVAKWRLCALTCLCNLHRQ